MTCPKCTGCVLWNYEEHYCVNCGERPFQPRKHIDPTQEETWRAEGYRKDPTKCTCGKPKCEDHSRWCVDCRAYWRAYDRRRVRTSKSNLPVAA